MQERLRRPWFRFSLRTIFILLTALCIWLIWQAGVIRHRREVLRQLRAAPHAFQIITVTDESQVGNAPQTDARISAVRWWLGDRPVDTIWCTPGMQGYSDELLARAKEAFPEAVIHERHPEPCHPGCFPRGTLVTTPNGRQLIETIQPGDLVTAIDATGEPNAIAVRSVFKTRNHLWSVETDAGALTTTETQPLRRADATFVTAGKLQIGDVISRYAAGDIQQAKVSRAARSGRTEIVFNLILGESEVFVANGFLARSKPPAAISENK